MSNWAATQGSRWRSGRACPRCVSVTNCTPKHSLDLLAARRLAGVLTETNKNCFHSSSYSSFRMVCPTMTPSGIEIDIQINIKIAI